MVNSYFQSSSINFLNGWVSCRFWCFSSWFLHIQKHFVCAERVKSSEGHTEIFYYNHVDVEIKTDEHPLKAIRASGCEANVQCCPDLVQVMASECQIEIN